MDNLQVFKNAEFGEIRIVRVNGEPYFIGKDVATILGYSNPRDAISKHVDMEDKGVAKCDTLGGIQEMTIINESGVYALIFGSKLASAKKFKHWVTSEVLPSIRKHGMYARDELLNDPDLLIAVATQLKDEREKNGRLLQKIAEDRPKTVFADAVATARTSILIGELAKILKQNGIDTGEKRLFAWLRDHGYLVRRRGTDYNAPTQKAMERKLFEVKETAVSHADGHVTISKTTKVTGIGQQYFINKFLNERGAAYE